MKRHASAPLRVLVRGALVMSFAVVLAACADEPVDEATAVPRATVPAGAEMEVVVRDRAFAAEEVTISVGDTVTWINEGDLGHTITNGTDGAPAESAEFDQPLSVGNTVSYTFEEAGTYPVTCTIHPDMQMTVIVEP